MSTSEILLLPIMQLKRSNLNDGPLQSGMLAATDLFSMPGKHSRDT